MLLRRANGWATMLGDKASMPVGDSGCLPVTATRILHKAGSAEANSSMPDRAAWLVCGAINEVGRVALPSNPTDCAVREGDFHASTAAATSRLLDGVGGRAPDFRAAAVVVYDIGKTAGRGETVNPAIGPTNSAAASVSAKQTNRDAATLSWSLLLVGAAPTTPNCSSSE